MISGHGTEKLFYNGFKILGLDGGWQASFEDWKHSYHWQATYCRQKKGRTGKSWTILPHPLNNKSPKQEWTRAMLSNLVKTSSLRLLLLRNFSNHMNQICLLVVGKSQLRWNYFHSPTFEANNTSFEVMSRFSAKNSKSAKLLQLKLIPSKWRPFLMKFSKNKRRHYKLTRKLTTCTLRECKPTLGAENRASSNSRFWGSRASRRENWTSPSWTPVPLSLNAATAKRQSSSKRKDPWQHLHDIN